MYTHHRFDHEYPPGTPVRVAYLVCATPRTGSSLLCELLALSGVAGAPTEYFDREQEHRFCAAWGCDPGPGYVRALLDRKTDPTGAFGAKVHWGQLVDAEHRYGAHVLEPILGAAHLVHVRRRDGVAQAVSYVIAEQTGRWASTHAAVAGASYDADAIARRLDEVVRDDQAWQAWFASRGVAPLEVWFEDLVIDPRAEVQRVLAHLGLDPGAAPAAAAATLERQADERNQTWARRFRAGLLA